MGKKDAPQRNPERDAKAAAGLNLQGAKDTLGLNSLDRTNSFGSSTFTKDANGLPTAINNTLNPELQASAGNVTGALGSQTASLPTNFNFDNSTVGNILSTGMQTYDDLAQDPIRQGQTRVSQEIANRGLPINDQISTDLQGNFDRQNGLARQSAFSTLYGQLPGMQSTLDQNTIRQGMAPAAAAQTSLGLLSSLGGLAPQASQPQAGVGSAAPAYQQAVDDNYKAQLAQYNANQGMFGAIGKGLGSLVTMPLVGPAGLSNTLLGSAASGLGGLFNGS